MQAKYIKKIYISLMSILLLMLTAVTTTFAWVGFLDTSFFDNFNIDLKASELGEYGLQISLTGEEGSFSNSIPSHEVKKAILKKAGYKNVDSMTKEQIEKTDFKMTQCTVKRMGTSLESFRDVQNQETKQYISFNLFLSSTKSADVEDSSSTYYMDAFLNDNIFKGTVQTKKLLNDFQYPTKNGMIDFESLYGINPPSFSTNNLIQNPHISGDITVNSASACRLAIEIKKPVPLYDTTAYLGTANTIIYQGGTQYPTYNSNTKEYSFGGILPDDYNIAINDFNTKIMQGYTEKTVPDWALNRGDLEFKNDGIVNRIINSNDSKVGIDEMVQLTIHFWYEGWDADCFSVINQSPVSLNLSFSNYHY